MAAENLLLLPGMMCDERLWSHQVEQLALPVVHADTTSSDSIADMAERILADAPERFAMAGLSMGGIVAFEIWRQAPERVTHMALLNTSPYADTPERRTSRLDQIEIALSGGLRELAIESLKPLYLAKSRQEDTGLLTLIIDMVVDLGADVFQRQSLALRDRQDSVPTLGTIDCPTLVLCGDEDSLCPTRFHQAMAEQIAGARLSVVDDCGHLSTLEQPEIVTSELRQLLAT